MLVCLPNFSIRKKITTMIPFSIHLRTIQRICITFLCSYTVATGLVDLLAKRCMIVKESVESQQSVVLSLLATIGLLTKIAELCPKGEFLLCNS